MKVTRYFRNEFSPNTRIAFGPYGRITRDTPVENVPKSLLKFFDAVEVEAAEAAAPETPLVPPPTPPPAPAPPEPPASDLKPESGAPAVVPDEPPAIPDEDPELLPVVLPIAGYSDLGIKAILPLLDGLDAHQLAVIRNFESANKKRTRIIAHINTLLQDH